MTAIVIVIGEIIAPVISSQCREVLCFYSVLICLLAYL